MNEKEDEMWFKLTKEYLTTEEKLIIIREYNLAQHDKDFAEILEKYKHLLPPLPHVKD